MSDLIIEKVNSSCVHLVCEDGLSHRFYNVFSAYAPGYRFNPRFKLHVWDGKVRCYNPITQILPIGLLNNLLIWCDQHKIEYSLQGFDKPLRDNIDKAELEKQMNSYITAGFQARDYQVNAVHAALTNRRGVLLSCTGSGKSLMIYTFLRYLLDNKDVHRAILIVPSVSLVEQMFSDFRDYGWDDLEDHVEMLYSGKKPTFKKEILISTWQSLEKEDPEFFEVYDACVVDECHQAKCNVVTRLLKLMHNAEYKIGTSGTLPTEISEQLQINSVIGNVLFELKSCELIARGYLTKLNIAAIFLKYPLSFIEENKERTYPEEVKMVEEYPNRNKVLNFIIDHTSPMNNMLILVNHRNHLKDVEDYLHKNYPEKKVSIITGDVKAKVREEIRVGIEDEDGTILLATYQTMSTGVNIPKLHAIMLFSNSKSRIKVLQSIGRGLRKHNSKNKVIIYDIVDDLSYKKRTGRIAKNYCMQHFDERSSYYIEQEFPVITTKLDI
jgi:superfamily II DNA or RNA helicase